MSLFLTSLYQLTNSASKFEIPLRQVLAAEYIDTSRTLKISCIRKRRRNLPYSLCSIEGEVLEVTDEHLNEWTEGLLSSAYDGWEHSSLSTFLAS